MTAPVRPDHFQQRSFPPALAVAGILILAFFLRFYGISFGLPHLYHADEPIVVNHALAYGTGDLNPHFFKIPPLLSYLLFIVYGVLYFTGHIFGSFTDISDFERVFYNDPTVFYFSGRLLFGALLGTASIYLLYALISRYFDRGRALLSALFLAVCFLHVRDSHYIYPDIPLVLILIAGFLPLFRILETGELKAHISAGFWIGLAASMKYNGAALCIPYFFAFLLSANKSGFISKIFFAGFAAVLTSVALNPFTILDHAVFLQEFRDQAFSQTGVKWAHHIKRSLSEGVSLPLLAMALVGMARVLTKPEPRRILILSFILTYYCILIAASQPYERYVLPLLPFVLFFSADFLVFLAEKQRPLRILSWAVIVIGVVLNGSKSMNFNRIMASEDVRTQAKGWIEGAIPSSASIATDIEFYMPKLNLSKQQLEEKVSALSPDKKRNLSRKINFLLSQPAQEPAYRIYALTDNPRSNTEFLLEKPEIAFKVQDLRSAGVEYVIIARLWEKDVNDAFYEEMKASSDLMARFSPYKDGSQPYSLDHPLTGGPFLWKDLLRRERNGQPLEIYRLKPVVQEVSS